MFRTGQTIYEQIVSVDTQNNPESGATFTSLVFKNGVVFTGLAPTITLTHAPTAVFTSSWSAETIGDYQIYYKNNITNVIYMSEMHKIKPDSEFDQTIYIGL